MEIDPIFYKKMYFDLRNLSDEQLKKHFVNHGFWEGRICNENFLKIKQEKNFVKFNKNMEILDKIIDDETFQIEEKLINIIIRTHNRPLFFQKNLNSIKNLNYKNLKIYISYENENTLEYIENECKEMINVYPIKVFKKDAPAFYNDYCNQVLENINEGYVMFLDDDDMITHKNSFKYINKNLQEDRVLCWEYLRSDKIIGPVKGNIARGQITSCGFCYHSKHKSKWGTVRGGDHIFVRDLINNNNLKIGKIKQILTRAISLNIVYGEGLANDYVEKEKDIVKEVVDGIIDNICM